MKEITSRYAEALYSLKKDENSLESSQKEIKELIKVLKENPDFLVVLNSSYKEFEEKEQIIDKVFIGVDEEIKTLIKIVVKNHRGQYLTEIFENYNSLVNEYRGVIEGLVYSTEPLSESQLAKLNSAIGKIETRPVELKNIIDPSLIGGVKVVINDHIYDGSIKRHINDMKIALLK
jgi:F-type H+-transporting ATPase subunit delta